VRARTIAGADRSTRGVSRTTKPTVAFPLREPTRSERADALAAQRLAPQAQHLGRRVRLTAALALVSAEAHARARAQSARISHRASAAEFRQSFHQTLVALHEDGIIVRQRRRIAALATEDRGSEGRGTEPDNVVRLPRDWLGPRDELVPFGPRASSDSPPWSAEDHGGGGAPSADDFWGGAEVPHGPVAEGAAVWPENEGAVASRSRARTSGVRRPRLGWVTGAPAAALVIALVVSLGVFSRGGGPASRPGAGVGAGSLLGAAGTELGHARIVLHLALGYRGVAARAVPHQRSAIPRARARGAGAGSSAPAARSPAGPSSSSGSSSTYSAPAVHYAPATTTSTSTPAPAAPAPGSASTARSGGGSGSGSAAGPTGQGALVGPASCSC